VEINSFVSINSYLLTLNLNLTLKINDLIYIVLKLHFVARDLRYGLKKTADSPRRVLCYHEVRKFIMRRSHFSFSRRLFHFLHDIQSRKISAVPP